MASGRVWASREDNDASGGRLGPGDTFGTVPRTGDARWPRAVPRSGPPQYCKKQKARASGFGCPRFVFKRCCAYPSTYALPLELKFLQAIEYHVFTRKGSPTDRRSRRAFPWKAWPQDRLQVLAVGGAIDSVLDVGPNLHSVTLNDNVCVFTRDAGLNQGKAAPSKRR